MKAAFALLLLLVTACPVWAQTVTPKPQTAPKPPAASSPPAAPAKPGAKAPAATKLDPHAVLQAMEEAFSSVSDRVTPADPARRVTEYTSVAVQKSASFLQRVRNADF